MLLAEDVAVGKIGSAAIATMVRASAWTFAGVLLACVIWLLAGRTAEPALPLSVFLYLYPGIGLWLGVSIGLVFTVVLILLKPIGTDARQIMEGRAIRFATLVASIMGFAFGATMFEGSIISVLIALLTAAIIATAGSAAARVSAPWILRGVGS